MDKLVAMVVRHGDSELNDLGIFRGWKDVPLTDLGIDQARKAATFLTRFKFNSITCSPLLRAFQTASIITDQLNIIPHQTRGLFPWQLGIFTGLDKNKHREALDLFVDNPDVQIPEGESLTCFLDRQFFFWDNFLKRDGINLVIAHNSCIMALSNMIEEEEQQFAKNEVISTGGIIGIYGSPRNYKIKCVFKQEKAQSDGVIS